MTVRIALVLSPLAAAPFTVIMVVPGLMGRLATVHFDVPSATPLSPLSVDHRTT
jgi:hypothetical protein